MIKFIFDNFFTTFSIFLLFIVVIVMVIVPAMFKGSSDLYCHQCRIFIPAEEYEDHVRENHLHHLE